MKLVLCFLIAILSFTVSPGVHTGNGGGLSEANIAYIWAHFKVFNNELIKKIEPSLSQHERNALKEISANHSLENPKLVYKSGHPHLFKYKIFFTESFVGATIFINLDLLEVGTGADARAMNLNEAYLLISEILLTHRQGQIDFEQLKLKLNLGLQKKIFRKSFAQFGEPNIGIEFYNFNGPSLNLLNDEGRIDITSKLHTALECQNYVIHYLNFSDATFNYFDQTNATQEAQFKGQIKFYCNEILMSADVRTFVTYKIKSVSGAILKWNWYGDLDNTALIQKDTIQIELSGITQI